MSLPPNFVGAAPPTFVGSDGNNKTGVKHVQDCVCTKALSLVGEDGNEAACLRPMEGGAGLWIHTPGGGCIAIYSIKGQTGIGYYSAKAVLAGDPMTFAISAGKDGPNIQICTDDGKLAMISTEQLLKIAKL